MKAHRYNLTLNTPPVAEPVTLDEAILQCHAETGIEDSWFRSRIAAGRQKVEEYVKRSLAEQTWALHMDGSMPNRITLPRPPVKELVKVEFRRGHTEGSVDITGEVVLVSDGCHAEIEVPVKYTCGVLRIEYKAGYAHELLPRPLLDAILLYVAHNYENRAGERDLPKAFYDLIEQYRLFEGLD